MDVPINVASIPPLDPHGDGKTPSLTDEKSGLKVIFFIIIILRRRWLQNYTTTFRH